MRTEDESWVAQWAQGFYEARARDIANGDGAMTASGCWTADPRSSCESGGRMLGMLSFWPVVDEIARPLIAVRDKLTEAEAERVRDWLTEILRPAEEGGR